MAFPDAQSAAHTSLSVQDSEATLWRWAALEPSRCGQANGHWWVRYNGNQRPIFHPGSPLFIENAILEESVRQAIGARYRRASWRVTRRTDGTFEADLHPAQSPEPAFEAHGGTLPGLCLATVYLASLELGRWPARGCEQRLKPERSS